MKLHRLEITAFGPYPGQVEVDFDQLDEAGVYLLTGPTGAGKTTVLDAISYALFGEIPRARRRAKVVSDHRDIETTPRVILEATIGGERIRINRVPQHDRPKAKGAGTTKQSQSVLVEVHVGGEWALTGERWSECNEDLTRRIGMNADQFCQVVMLPQGDFAKFLKADVRSRQDLLEKLFPGKDLAWMEDWFNQRARVDRDARTAKLSEISTRFEQVRTIATSLVADPEDALPETGEAGPARDWIDRSGSALDARLAERETARAAANATAEKADLELKVLNDRAGAIEKKLKAEGELAKLEGRLEWRAERGEEIKQASKAAAVRLLATQASELAATEQSARETADRLAAELEREPLTESLDPEQLPQAENDLRSQITTIINFENDELPVRRKLSEKTARLETELGGLELDGPESPRGMAAAALKQAGEQEERAKRQLIEIRNARTRGMAAELAGELKDGEPCAVCGSPEHPSPAHGEGPRITREQEEEAEEARERASAVGAEAVRELNRVESELGARKAKLQTELAAGKESLAGLKAKENELSADAATIGERRDTLTGAANLIRDLLDARKTVAEKARASAEASRKAKSKAGEQSFESVDQALEASREEATLQRLNSEVNEYDKRLAIVRNQLNELAAIDTTEQIDLEPARLRSAATGAARDEATGKASIARDELEKFREVTNAIPALYEELEPLRQAAAVSDELDRMTNGNNERRTKLSIFVLATRLRQVIDAANRHLQKMSDQRYELVYSGDLVGHGAASGLGIEVFDAHTSENRPTSSLSGGESFWASLSLALGLAEIVAAESGGKTIETLFIDEGFGTLDSESLGNVIDVIDSLREGGRSVGLVSHVEEMKLRIPAQIRVKAGKQGSVLEVVA